MKDSTRSSVQDAANMANSDLQPVSDKAAMGAGVSGQTAGSVQAFGNLAGSDPSTASTASPSPALAGLAQNPDASSGNSPAGNVSETTFAGRLSAIEQMLFAIPGSGVVGGGMKDSTRSSVQNTTNKVNSDVQPVSDKAAAGAGVSGQSAGSPGSNSTSGPAAPASSWSVARLVSLSGPSGPAAPDAQFIAEKSISDKAAPVAVAPAQTAGSDQTASSGSASDPSTASVSSGSIAQQEALGLPMDLTEKGADPGLSSNSPLQYNVAVGASEKAGADRLTAIEQLVLGGQAGAVAAKRINEPSISRDSSPGPAMLQASLPNLQTINMSPAGNSSQGGFSSYDPYRAVELANEIREQAPSAAGGTLVLDMVSEGLGKVNLKVEAKKGEISVEAMTQNEPAKQALMDHSVELRQDLRNQGLVLGKFMVDVNGGGHQGGGGTNADQYGGKGRGPYKPVEVRAAKLSEATPSAAAVTGQSRISVFA